MSREGAPTRKDLGLKIDRPTESSIDQIAEKFFLDLKGGAKLYGDRAGESMWRQRRDDLELMVVNPSDEIYGPQRDKEYPGWSDQDLTKLWELMKAKEEKWAANSGDEREFNGNWPKSRDRSFDGGVTTGAEMKSPLAKAREGLVFEERLFKKLMEEYVQGMLPTGRATEGTGLGQDLEVTGDRIRALKEEISRLEEK
ncbi:MAG: hypothetical protein Q7S48_01575 [bacterium]|nr:hypothetical protein [bacterium]